MAFQIKPDLVDTYLSGICNTLEVYFPNIRKSRSSPLVSRTLEGAKRARGTQKRQKRPLTIDDLRMVLHHHETSQFHDDFLFVSILLTGFYALLRLGELVYPNKRALRDPRKLILRSSIIIDPDQYSFLLPGHKADQTFEGHLIIIPENNQTRPRLLFMRYLESRDRLFPLSSPLWIKSNGSVPKQSWFIKRLCTFFDSDVAGQSMRAGGATALACAGVSYDLIQAIGRWTSPTFKIYIRKNPVFVQAMIWAKRN